MLPPRGFGSRPYCGKTGSEFYPESLELIEGAAGINLYKKGQNYAADWDGQTDVDWDSSATIFYRCGSCQAPLPESHQLYLETVLGKPRLKKGL